MDVAREAHAEAERARRQPAQRALLFPFVLDYVIYGIGMSGISIATFLPMFLRSLTPSDIVIGLIPTLQMLGRTLPVLFIARWLERQGRLKYWVILAMLVERLPLVLCGLWILLPGTSVPQTLLWGVLALWLLYNLGGGCATSIWTNLVARVVPANLRGRMGGWGGGVSALTGIAVAVLARYLFGVLGLRVGYGLCFLGAGVLMFLVSFVFLRVREQPNAVTLPNISLWTYLAGLPDVLRRDHRFVWFLVARALWVIGSTATSFYTVYAMARFSVTPAMVAWLAMSMSLGGAMGSFLGGFGADAVGNKRVLVASALLLATATLVALLAQHQVLLYVLYAINAIGQSSGMLSTQNLPLELARKGQVATYLAINTALLGPVTALAPLAAGVMVGYTGYHTLFAISAASSLLAVIVLCLRVPEPRGRVGALLQHNV
jgi:MFS family permease